MIVIALVFCIIGISFLCWLVFALTVYALPLFAGMMAGLSAYDSGAGIIGALFVGFVAGAVTLVAGQIALAVIKPPLLRGAIALLFVAPATLTGYHAVLGLAQICVPSAIWREIFAVAGAVFSFLPRAQNLADSVSTSRQERNADMAKFDWRPETYEKMHALDAAGLAWEFLRRNPDYQRDYLTSNDTSSVIGQLSLVRHWGLSFPCRSNAFSPRASRVLVAIDCTRRCPSCSCL